MRNLILLALVAGIATGDPLSAAELPLEAYSRPATVSSMAISPDGALVAFRRRDETMDAVFIVNRHTQAFAGVIEDFGAVIQDIHFLDDHRLVLLATENRRIASAAGRTYQVSGSFVFDLQTNRLSQLLVTSPHLEPRQLGIGRIIGHDSKRDVVYMPARVSGNKRNYARGVLEVDLDSLDDKIVVKGHATTVNWFLGSNGEILAEEEDDDGVQRIWDRRSGKRVLIYESSGEKARLQTIGLSPDRQSIVVSAVPENSDFEAYYTINLADGNLGPARFHLEGSDIEGPVMGLDQVVYGVEYAGFYPRYEFFDSSVTERVRAVQSAMGATPSYLVDWTPDFEHLVFLLSGGTTSGTYVVVDSDAPKPKFLTWAREAIPAAAVAPTSRLRYAARDGLEIPALLTARSDVQSAGNAPLIVLPHGGPNSHDRYEFDWLVQYLASRGALVLQPQFRGSTGFGNTLRDAAFGQWGAAMSTDLDDGVAYLVENGLADPKRVCMVGRSYGGYAALAAGAFSSFDYKCLISISGISNLERMKDTMDRMYAGEAFDFGERMTDQRLDQISPVNFAGNFRSSVLLIHGRDDTVVPFNQSLEMEKALRRAKKTVQLVRLKGEDHYLSRYETRLEALRAIAAFLDERL